MASLYKDSPIAAIPQAPTDVLRDMLHTMIQETLAREFQEFVGAAPFERTLDRRDVRNGYRQRRFATRVGTLTLRIPRDRSGQFQPTLFARYQRSEQALVATLTEMYFQGVSTRKVTKVVEQLCGASISASEVSVLVKRLDGDLEAWRTRSLGGTSYRALVVDAHVERVRREGQVRSSAALWVIGIRADGYREHLGVWLGASESGASWRRVFEQLVQRGLTDVAYVVSDEHAGLVDAIHRFFPDALHQRCQVHYLRNALDHVSSELLHDQVKNGLRDVWAAPTRGEAEQRVVRLLDALRPVAPRLVEWLETTIGDTLTVYALPDATARRHLRNTNSIEHDHMAVRRRTRVIRVFPNEASLVRLLSALAMERNEQWLARRYLLPQDTMLKQESQPLAA